MVAEYGVMGSILQASRPGYARKDPSRHLSIRSRSSRHNQHESDFCVGISPQEAVPFVLARPKLRRDYRGRSDGSRPRRDPWRRAHSMNRDLPRFADPRDRKVSIHQVVAHRIIGEFGIGLHSHLLENSRAVSTDRLYAQPQLLSDLAHRLARCDRAKDLKLAIG